MQDYYKEHKNNIDSKLTVVEKVALKRCALM